MTRLAIVAFMVLAGCANKRAAESDGAKSSAPSPAAGGARGQPPAAAPPPAPDLAPANAKEAARESGLLGPSDQDLFTDINSDHTGRAGTQGNSNRAAEKREKPKHATTGGDTRVRRIGEPVGVDAPGTGAASSDMGGGGGGTRGPSTVAPKATLGRPTLGGGADAVALAGALANRLADVKACYVRVLAAKPGLEGELAIAFTVKADGTLTAVSATSSTVKHPELEACIVGVVRATKLDRPLGTSDVNGSVPITLRLR